ncbi:MAG: hypothetical protein WC692_00335 [Erythrobacter sp.]|jgi:hypothetical protein
MLPLKFAWNLGAGRVVPPSIHLYCHPSESWDRSPQKAMLGFANELGMLSPEFRIGLLVFVKFHRIRRLADRSPVRNIKKFKLSVLVWET